MAHDPVVGALGARAPISVPELERAFARFEDRSLADLQRLLADANARFRAWVEDPANAGRPIQDADGYVERIALDVLLERRLFTE